MYIAFSLRRYFFVFVFLFLSIESIGQRNDFHYYTKLISTAEFVVEGKVFASESLWDRQHRNIYTCYSLEIKNDLKGTVRDQIKVVVKGGRVNDTWQLIIPSIEFQVGDEGYFLLDPLSENLFEKEGNAYVLSSGSQSFLLYGGKDAKTQYFNEEGDLFLRAIENVADKPVTKKYSPVEVKSGVATQIIDSISPHILTAGTQDILNIYGSGFGATKDLSKVWFVLSDRPEYIYSNDLFEYLTWSDSLIQIYVPYKAATGKVTVEVNSKKLNSSDTLQIRYACTNSSRTNEPVYLVNMNEQGGYSWHLHSNLSRYEPAAEIITESINEWVCATSVPWRIESDVKSEQAKDGQNTIAFGSVANSVDEMGQTSLFMNTYPESGNDTWVLEEIDIMLSDSDEWCFTGDCEGTDKYDFKTVIMHHLAHALLIDHVNNPDDLMNYSLEKGEVREMGENNIECAGYILSKSEELNHPDFMTINPYQFESPVVNRNKDTLSTSYIFTSYQWYDADGIIPGATESVYVATKTGEYHLEGINEFGCSMVSEPVEVFILDNHATTGEILLYPNPTQDELHIESVNPFDEAIFFNILGQKILQVALDPESTTNTFQLGGLPKGVYTVWLINTEEKIRRKFVVY